MGRFLLILSFFLFATGVCRAALSPQAYWHTVLPNAPMPSAIRDLLHPADEIADEKTGTAVNVGKGSGVNVNTGKGTTVNVGRKGVGVNTGGNTHVGVSGGGVGVSTGNKGKPDGTNVNVGKGGVGVSTGHKGKPVVVAVGPHSPFSYIYAATETQIRDDPNVALFFLENDLRPGTKMTLLFTKTTSGAAFIPRSTANSIPFSAAKLPEVLDRFSIEPNSVEAGAMKKTLGECEAPAAEGERKYCATSLESMVDFSTASLGTNHVQAVATEVGKTAEGVRQEYRVAPSGVQRMPGARLVACHAEPYAYAVFYCHATGATRAYKVALVGKDGAAVEAVAVCHTDTAAWNPKHVAFQVLKVKPGSVPVCHFLPQDHVVWTPTA